MPPQSWCAIIVRLIPMSLVGTLLIAPQLACGSNAPTQPTKSIASVSVSGGASFGALNQTSQLSAIASYSDNSQENVTDRAVWRTSNPSVVTVSGTGLVTALGFGVSDVSATYQEKTGSVSATVKSLNCTFSLSYTSRRFNSSGNTDSVGVQASETDCAWTASSEVSWIRIGSGATGTGSGGVGYTVDSHSGATPREGTLNIAGSHVAVTQDGPTAPPLPTCIYGFSPASLSFASTGGSAAVSVTASPSDCRWTASSGSSWIVITSGSAGVGNASLSYRADANPSPTARTGTIRVDGLSGQNPPGIHTVSQAAAAQPCQYGLTSAKTLSFGAGGGSGTITFQLQTGSCQWTASSPDAWISVQDASGSGSISIRFTAAANSASSGRSGRIEVRWPGPQVGENILVSQAGR
jgi:BACON domain-containing protein/Big-like domain-containing protein/all-beta uncharacterized protein